MLYTGSNQKHLFLGKYISIHNIHQGNIYFLMLIQVSVSAQTTTTLKLRKHSILKFIGTVKKHSCNVGDGQWGGTELQGGILVWVLNGISLLPILLDTLAPKTTGVTPIWTKKKKKKTISFSQTGSSWGWVIKWKKIFAGRAGISSLCEHSEPGCWVAAICAR